MYTLHFRQSDFPFLLTDIVFQPGAYGDFDYRVLQQEDNIAGFLTQKGLKQAYNFGSRLLNKGFAKKIVSQLEGLDKKIRNIGLFKNIDKFGGIALIKRWGEIEQYSKNIAALYRYCEQPVLAPLEDIVFRACGKNQDKLIAILKNPKLAKSFGFSDKEKRALDLLIKLGKLKFSIHQKMDPSWIGALDKFSQIVAKKYNLSKKQASVLRSNELKKALRGIRPKVEILNERLKGCIFLPPAKGKKWQCLTGKDFQAWQNKLEPASVSQITGTVAYPGKTKGKVKLHLSLVGASKIPQGTVVVSGMTNPQIVPLLKNAAAIVTDEGGLTCHAAIVSRELKIPCIIGTKIATKALRDGQVVEVDANRGVVKILKTKDKK